MCFFNDFFSSEKLWFLKNHQMAVRATPLRGGGLVARNTTDVMGSAMPFAKADRAPRYILVSRRSSVPPAWRVTQQERSISSISSN